MTEGRNRMSILCIEPHISMYIWTPRGHNFAGYFSLHYWSNLTKWVPGMFSVPKSNPTLNDPIDSSVLGASQARILEWVAISFSRGSSQPRN